MFINHTNHSSKYWSDEQLVAARQYGDIIDMPFPVLIRWRLQRILLD